MNFHEVRFPANLSFGSIGGPERHTDIVTLANGYEERIYVRGDKDADYGTVMRVMARISAAGFRNLGLVTLQEQDS